MKKSIKLGASIVALALIVVGVGGNLQVVSAAEGAMSPAFTDTKGHWAKSYIDRIAEKGIVQGKSRNRYAPDDNLSRAELLKIALNSFNFDVPDSVDRNPLPDVQIGDWFAPYVKSAFDNGIIFGFGEGFQPNAPASRGMAVTILVKAAGYNDVDEHFQNEYKNRAGWTYAHFPDVLMNAYFTPYIAYLADKQVISGYEDGTFGPGNSITRAEIAKIVVNLLGLSPVASELQPSVSNEERQSSDEKETWEITGTYYNMSGRGSAMYFRTKDEPDRELHLQNAELFLNDKQLYEDMGLKEIYEVNDPGCSSFWGEATLEVSTSQFSDENKPAVGFVRVIKKDEPVCGPSSYELEKNPVLEKCGSFPQREMTYNPEDVEYLVCYDEVYYRDNTENGCYLTEIRPTAEPYGFSFDLYSMDGKAMSGGGWSSRNLTVNYEKCLQTTEAYFNSIVK